MVNGTDHRNYFGEVHKQQNLPVCILAMFSHRNKKSENFETGGE